jgi:arylsulfatase A-like enzyme
MRKVNRLLWCSVLLSTLVSSFSYAEEKPANIIFLLADDHRWDRFGFMGHKWLKTPNLDQLAGEGVVFTQGYHAAPICKPARASIMLGQYLNTHMSGFDKPSDWVVTYDEFEHSYPSVMRKAGYYTGFVGKFGFPVSDIKEKNVAYIEGKRSTASQLWLNDKYLPKKQFDYWYGKAGQGQYSIDGEHGTKVRMDHALDFIQQAQKGSQPFMLSLSFKAPHAPYQPSDKWRRYYSNITIPDAELSSPEHHETLPNIVKSNYRGSKGYGKAYQKSMRGYYGLISGIDEQVGRLRTELKQMGLAENTIIIYSSDNGYFTGSRGLKGKELLYRESVRAPLIIYSPQLPKAQQSRVEQGLFSTIDFAPTLLDMAGIKAPNQMQGVSLLPLLTQQQTQVNKVVFSENNFSSFQAVHTNTDTEQSETVRAKAVQNSRYRYIRYHETNPVIEQLFDVLADPDENNNLADNIEYKKVLNEMRGQLSGFVAKTQAQRSADFKAVSK